MPDYQRRRGFSIDQGVLHDEPMIPLSEMWHNGGKRLLAILIVISCLILLVVGGVALGMFVLDTRIKGLNERVGVVEGEQSLAQRQADIRAKVDENTAALRAYETAVNQSWRKFQEHNPTAPVPQITEAERGADGIKADVVVIPPKSTPKPTAPPREKTRTIIKYKKAPTPRPWWQRK